MVEVRLTLNEALGIIEDALWNGDLTDLKGLSLDILNELTFASDVRNGL